MANLEFPEEVQLFFRERGYQGASPEILAVKALLREAWAIKPNGKGGPAQWRRLVRHSLNMVGAFTASLQRAAVILTMQKAISNFKSNTQISWRPALFLVFGLLGEPSTGLETLGGRWFRECLRPAGDLAVTVLMATRPKSPAAPDPQPAPQEAEPRSSGQPNAPGETAADPAAPQEAEPRSSGQPHEPGETAADPAAPQEAEPRSSGQPHEPGETAADPAAPQEAEPRSSGQPHAPGEDAADPAAPQEAEPGSSGPSHGKAFPGDAAPAGAAKDPDVVSVSSDDEPQPPPPVTEEPPKFKQQASASDWLPKKPPQPAPKKKTAKPAPKKKPAQPPKRKPAKPSASTAKRPRSAATPKAAPARSNIPEVQMLLQGEGCPPLQVLGLWPAVQPPTRAEIRRAYYKVAAQVHPDKCACPCATKAFQILNGAYQALL